MGHQFPNHVSPKGVSTSFSFSIFAGGESPQVLLFQFWPGVCQKYLSPTPGRTPMCHKYVKPASPLPTHSPPQLDPQSSLAQSRAIPCSTLSPPQLKTPAFPGSIPSHPKHNPLPSPVQLPAIPSSTPSPPQLNPQPSPAKSLCISCSPEDPPATPKKMMCATPKHIVGATPN